MADTTGLSGVQRAAVVLLSLGEQQAAEVLKHMSAKEVQKLGVAMTSVSGVSREAVGRVIDPAPVQLQRLANLHPEQLADDRDEVVFAARLHPSDGVAVLLAVERDAFEDAFEA